MKRVVDDLTRPVSCRPHSRRIPERIDGGKALNIPPEAPSCHNQRLCHEEFAPHAVPPVACSTVGSLSAAAGAS